MLTQLLPGFRQVRTPMITGYLYGVLAWVIFGHDALIFDPGARGIEGEIAHLADAAGHNAVLGACALVAYLLGTLLTVTSLPANDNLNVSDRLHDFFHLGFGSYLSDDGDQVLFVPPWRQLVHDFATEVSRELEGRLNLRILRESNTGSRLFKAVEERVNSRQQGMEGGRSIQSAEPMTISAEDLRDPIKDAIVKEITGEILATKLQVEHESLFTSYDREVSEAELRYSMFIPLLALSTVTAIVWSPWFILALLVPIALVRFGVKSEERSRVIILVALNSGALTSPTVKGLRKAAKANPDESFESGDSR